MSSLYHIASEYLAIADQLEESGGEITPDIEQALAINREQLQEKAGNYALVIKDFEHKNAAVDEAITELKKSRQKAMESLKNRLKSAMELYGVERIESDFVKLSFRKSEAVEIESEDLIPPIFKEQVVTEKIDKTAIKAALKGGTEVPGARLDKRQNLQIK
jgi:molecular chaperone GrpE (heat shock protein)